jgi:hypothetical protein
VHLAGGACPDTGNDAVENPQQVDLPQPDGPISAVIFARNVEVDVLSACSPL